VGEAIVSNDEAVLEAARAIRPYLTELVGSDANRVDTQIAALLGEAATGRDDIDVSILSLLREDQSTHAWAAAFLQAGLPPDVVAIRERSIGLPGRPEASPAPRYTCPEGDYVWYRRIVGDRVPSCPTHRITLQPSPTVA
jgi:hypothetical protein